MLQSSLEAGQAVGLMASRTTSSPGTVQCLPVRFLPCCLEAYKAGYADLVALQDRSKKAIDVALYVVCLEGFGKNSSALCVSQGPQALEQLVGRPGPLFCFDGGILRSALLLIPHRSCFSAQREVARFRPAAAAARPESWTSLTF